MTLEGRRWKLLVLARDDGTLAKVPDAVDAWLAFSEGRVSGSGGCNRLTGPYQVDGDRLSLGPLAGTMMACGEPHATVERLVLAAAERVAGFVDKRHTLDLVDASGHVVLSFIEGTNTPLLGTEWIATGINNGRGGVEGLLAHTTATARFERDGRVAGNAGCNRWSATYTTEGSAVSFGPRAVSRKFCAEPRGLMGQEERFLAALGRVSNGSIDADRLELRDAEGALQVAFRASRA